MNALFAISADNKNIKQTETKTDRKKKRELTH